MRADRALAALREVELNFEPRPLEAWTPERGWHVDTLSQRLPSEAPGDPAPGGTWEVARDLMADYRMADPAIVRATWDPDAPLLGRELLLELRLYRILSVRAGVRVTRAWDEQRVVAGRDARVFGFEYATLRGHVEMGRMDYEVYKWRDVGAVEFRLHAHWRASHEAAPWVRLGFRLVGRRQQLRFYFRCCERMARLTARQLGLPEDPPPPAVRLREADAAETTELGECACCRAAPSTGTRSEVIDSAAARGDALRRVERVQIEQLHARGRHEVRSRARSRGPKR